jgi:hypothetical protein
MPKSRDFFRKRLVCASFCGRSPGRPLLDAASRVRLAKNRPSPPRAAKLALYVRIVRNVHAAPHPALRTAVGSAGGCCTSKTPSAQQPTGGQKGHWPISGGKGVARSRKLCRTLAPSLSVSRSSIA